MNHSPRFVANSSSVLRPGATVLLAFLLFAAQSLTVTTAQQKNSNSGKRQPVTTLHSSDSQEGSRVAISSDRSLNNYEAYRRGDRFYVKIPAADVPRAEAVRGRGFADVTAQRSGDSTILSFRLQPGATAHVEQRASKLDVVVTVPGGGSPGPSPKRSGEPGRFNPGESDRSSTPRTTTSRNGNKNDSGRATSSDLAQLNLNSNKKAAAAGTSTSSTAKATPTANPNATPAPTPSLKSSPTPVASATITRGTVAQVSPAASPADTGTQSRNDLWARMKERGHYWILLAQLNPIPVAIGAAILILIIGLLLVQRRRAKKTRRVRPLKPTAYEPVTEPPPQNLRAAAAPEPKPKPDASIPLAAAAAVAVTDTTNATKPARVATPAPASLVDDARREHVNRVADEARKLFDGEQYNRAIIGSDDPDTRRLVGAELLSALVGRNAQKRERARAAFMEHGYFDDATRDLRVAESDNERAAAARRLSFVHDREATPHLIGALGDPSSDVRRASVEALMDLRDPTAIGPLNTLLQTENDRKVPRTLIKHAIEACATSAPETGPSAAPAAPAFSHPAPQSFETDREVIEI